jgi:shikimate dehydrogenase
MSDPAPARLGVIGWPVAHSLSPAMHNAALRALALEGWRYQLLPVAPTHFAAVLAALPALSFRGVNVTIPHKAAALELADRADAIAREIGAANTLCWDRHGELHATNTDAPGLTVAIERVLGKAALEGRRALVLGAGGSARAALYALLRAGFEEVCVWARRFARARELTEQLGGRPLRTPEPADLLVNCTPVGLERPTQAGHLGGGSEERSAPPSEPKRPARAGRLAGGASGQAAKVLEQSASEAVALNQLALTIDQLHEYSYVVDLAYRNGDTPLVHAARRLSIPALEGREILVAQGALSFALFTGREAPLEIMRAAAGL